jgi:hypothetical protein
MKSNFIECYSNIEVKAFAVTVASVGEVKIGKSTYYPRLEEMAMVAI